MKNRDGRADRYVGFGFMCIVIGIAISIFVPPRMAPKEVADSPDGKFRAYSGVRSATHLAVSDKYTTVEIGIRNRLLGGLAFSSKTILVCRHSQKITSQWKDPTTIMITAGCQPNVSRENKNDIEYLLHLYQGIKVVYDYKPEWSGDPVY
jgi:hypothetical protein